MSDARARTHIHIEREREIGKDRKRNRYKAGERRWGEINQKMTKIKIHTGDDLLYTGFNVGTYNTDRWDGMSFSSHYLDSSS